MDKNNMHIERRFSINTTHLANPIAESTCLNGTSSPMHWLSNNLSPLKQRSTSSCCLATNGIVALPHKNDKHNSSYLNSTSNNLSRQRINLSRIDPTTHADVHSSGLSARIVKYHDNGKTLQRSMSVNNLYSKPGQFPVVHLKRAALPYKAATPHLSMTRIAPPEKSLFYGNSLSSLLRSNSIIGVQKTDEELSCENRPILHPPASEGELAPTRSVLDVLKEISRKRINSTDLQMNSKKKSCQRDNNDLIDATAQLAHLGYPSHHQSYKRQREQMLQHQHQQHQQRMSNNLATISGSPPEQLAKRRNCTAHNNDITSSLSSSVMHTSKRKLQRALNVTTTSNGSPGNSPESKVQRKQNDLRFEHLSKSLSCQTPITPMPATPYTPPGNNNAYINHSMPSHNSTSISSAATLTNAMPAQRINSAPVASVATKIDVRKMKPKLTLFNKNYETMTTNAAAVDGSDNESGDDGIQFVKPKKLHANPKKNPLIERTQKSKLAMMLCGLRGELYQGGEGSDEVDVDGKQQMIEESKAQPVPITETTSATNKVTITSVKTIATPSFNFGTTLVPSLATTTTTNTTTTTTVATATSTLTTVATTTTTTSTLTITNATSPTMSTTATMPTTTIMPTFNFTPTANTTPTTTHSVTQIGSPLVGIKLTPAASTAFTTTTASVSDNIVPPATATTTTTAPAFSFGLSATTKATPDDTDTTNSLSVKTTAPPFSGFGGAPPSNTAPVNGTNVTEASAANNNKTTTNMFNANFSFGSAATASAAPPTTIATSSAVGFGNPTTTAVLSFGMPTTTTTAPVLSFGKPNPPEIISSSTTLPTFGAATTSSMAPPAFGSASNNSTALPSFGSNTPTANLSFGTQNTTTAPITAFGAVAKPTFTFGGNGGSTATTVATTTSGFGAFTNAVKSTSAQSFGTQNPTTTNTATKALSAFGGTFNQPATQTANQPFAFGANQQTNSKPAPPTTTTENNATATTTTSFSFGGSTKESTPASNAFSFAQQKSSDTTATKTFSFGSISSNTNNNAAQVDRTAIATNNSTSNPGAFAFGGSSALAAGAAAQNTVAPTANTSSFSFGGNNAATASKNAFSFGAAASTAGNAPTNHTTNSIFGGGATAASSNNSTANGTPFGFGAAASTQKTSIFGGGNSNSSSTTTATAAPTNSPFSFGGASQAPKQQTTSSTAGGFSFSAAAANTGNTTTNIFGGANTGAAAQTAAGQSSGFSFTNAASSDGANKLSATPTFGGLGASTQNKPFAFGSNSAAGALPSNNNATASGTNLFAQSGAVQNSTQPAVGGFAFGNKSTTNPAGAVGSSASNIQFSFNAAAGNGTQQNATKSFSFVSAIDTQNSNTAANVFGNVQTTQTANNSFGFGGGAGGMAPAAPTVNGGNLFAPSPTSGDRPIRRATRRLQR